MLMIRKAQEHRWERILRLEPRLSRYEAPSRIEAALAAFVQAKAFQNKRSLKRPWGFRYQDAANMRKRVTELKKEFQPYLPQQRTNCERYVKVRQCIADFSISLQDICANWNRGQSRRRNEVVNAKDCCRNWWQNLGGYESHSPERRSMRKEGGIASSFTPVWMDWANGKTASPTLL